MADPTAACQACSRRAFVRGAVALLPALPALPVLAACGGDAVTEAPDPSELDAVTITDAEVRVRLDRVPELAAVGGSLVIPEARVLLTRAAADEYRAFDGACPHAGSLVRLREGATLVCPAHGSTFDLRGALLRGPAPTGLVALPLRRVDARTLVAARP